jgi:alpha-amylase
MVKICLYFQVHQPERLAKYNVFRRDGKYFDDNKNKKIFLKVANKCYLPTNNLILKLIKETKGAFKVSYSMTGVFIDQALKYCPKVIESFKELVNTGCVDLLSETYYHSLAFLMGEKEFLEQVRLHRAKIKELFNYEPIVFRNTEAMYNNDLAKTVEMIGFKGVVAEGWHKYLEWRSPNFVYKPINSNIRLFLRNYRLSDDIGFRFSLHDWNEFPLTADKYATWLSKADGTNANIFIDYETFGEHQWRETGIFEFLEFMPREVLRHPHLSFVKISDLVNEEPVGVIDVPGLLSWADIDRDASAWLGNEMQNNAFNKLKELAQLVYGSGDHKLIDKWRRLQTSDHFYYMCTKWFADGDVHKYFNAYDNPYDAYINYMNILQDLKRAVQDKITSS